MLQPTTPDGQTTIRQIVVCLPDGRKDVPSVPGYSGMPVHASVYTVADGRLGRASRMFKTDLIDVRSRRGAADTAAGGRLGRLDLHRTKEIAWYEAMLRYDAWRLAVEGAQAAKPWPSFLARHEAAPEKYTRATAWDDFTKQSQVVAMTAHNECGGELPLDLLDLDLFQAGAETYGRASALRRICGDAFINPRGKLASPDGLTARAQLVHLGGVHRVLQELPSSQWLIALSLS